MWQEGKNKIVIMRMWMIDPKTLCNRHLLGEHGEIHKHRHNFVKQHSITKRISPVVQIEPSAMQSRHDVLAKEMLRRGMNHQSPFDQPDISYLPIAERYAVVVVHNSLNDLTQRCSECAKRIRNE
jgi:hypothetical protein